MLIKTEAMNDKTRATLSAIGKALNIDAIPPVINDFNDPAGKAGLRKGLQKMTLTLEQRKKAISLAQYAHCSPHEWPTGADVQLVCLALLEAHERLAKLHAVRPLDEWHEDMGPVLLHHMPICEPPYCGTPTDSGFASQLHAYTRFLLGGWTVEQAVVLVSHIKPVVDSIYRMNQCLGRDTNRMDCMSRALDAILPLTNHSPDQEPLSATDIDTGSH